MIAISTIRPLPPSGRETLNQFPRNPRCCLLKSLQSFFKESRLRRLMCFTDAVWCVIKNTGHIYAAGWLGSSVQYANSGYVPSDSVRRCCSLLFWWHLGWDDLLFARAYFMYICTFRLAWDGIQQTEYFKWIEHAQEPLWAGCLWVAELCPEREVPVMA